uniref:UBC core domain-containing protein n=1 Tax=Gadus morhua TaxID=8049 RepID=A0A8C5A3N5_GADMO
MNKTSKLPSTSAKRIQKELADITLDPPPNCSAGAGPKGDNIYEWRSTILRPPGAALDLWIDRYKDICKTFLQGVMCPKSSVC